MGYVEWSCLIKWFTSQLYSWVEKKRSIAPIRWEYFLHPALYEESFICLTQIAHKKIGFQFPNLLRTTSEVTFRFPKPTSDHLRSDFPISETYFGPPPKYLSDFQNLLRTTSEVAFRFPKPTLDHLRSAFPISKPTSDHLRCDFPISKTYFGLPPKWLSKFKTYFGPPPKWLSDFKTHFGPPPKWLSDFQNPLWTTSEVAFRFPKPTLDHLRSDFSISKTASGNMYKLYFLHLWAN